MCLLCVWVVGLTMLRKDHESLACFVIHDWMH